MFERLCGGLQNVGFLLLTDVKVVDDSPIELVENVALTADVVDVVAQLVVDRKRLIELLSHLQYHT